MTGFGQTSVEGPGFRLSVEVRSVNHRYLKVQLRLPRPLASLEPDLEAAVRRKILRGAVSATIHYSDDAMASRHGIDLEVAGRYLQDIEALQKSLELPREPLRADILVTLPGVVTIGPEGEDLPLADTARHRVLNAFDESLEGLVRARDEEGRRTAAALREHLATLATHVEHVAGRASEVPAALRDRLLVRVRALLQGLDPGVLVSEGDLLRELCMLSDKADVTEEIQRLRSHVQRFGELLDDEGEAGRKMEFLLQEMLRETNTIGSKANNTAIAHAVVEMKCEVERMKEQVQNVE